MMFEFTIYLSAILAWMFYQYIASAHETTAEQAIIRGKVIGLGIGGMSVMFFLCLGIRLLGI